MLFIVMHLEYVRRQKEMNDRVSKTIENMKEALKTFTVEDAKESFKMNHRKMNLMAKMLEHISVLKFENMMMVESSLYDALGPRHRVIDKHEWMCDVYEDTLIIAIETLEHIMNVFVLSDGFESIAPSIHRDIDNAKFVLSEYHENLRFIDEHIKEAKRKKEENKDE